MVARPLLAPPRITLSRRAALAGLATLATPGLVGPAEAQSFESFVAGLWPAASSAGVSRATFDRAFSGVQPNPRVIELSQRQPEFRRTLGDYVDVRASNKRVTNGRAAIREHAATFQAVQSRYGVPGEIVCSIWGNETSYGTSRGEHYVIQAMATLAAAGRRADFFRRELIAALRILQSGDTTPQNMIGSWAGAMGHVQFMPTSFHAFAVDFTGDGRRDIWTSIPDAMGSAANYLRRNGWQPGVPWGMEVHAPGLPGNRGQRKSFDGWAASGVRRIGEGSLVGGAEATLWKPAGEGGPHLLLTSNFNVIKRYNNADSYALAVAHLGDRIRGAGRFSKPWPPGEGGLTHADREEIQTRLNRLGFDLGDVDGILGDKSKQAVRTMQGRFGMPQTGEADRAFLERLRRG
ncbi:lytic murein transglycosylase [Phreatobacter oligotrophus]|uniref:Membrane-bound lytic murein transglycosylase B n=2 Tax=Pseudomonadota TaxID=1224 RepID=A0A2T4Z2L8_9HYPH|nr:lytic murein transglycosylase [Phreatobacter oligotrophus]PTM55029.1 membrane-bound lytic murein transglycosylase B [Phreatobacter oligotrophus]